MLIQCSTCTARYTVPDEKVLGRNVAVRCKRCGEKMSIRADAWHVAIDAETHGPWSADTIRARIADGTIEADACVWREGMDAWTPVAEVDAFADAYEPSAPEPSAVVSDASLTGERSESSVLFSLSNLKDLSRGVTAQTAAPQTTEGSGLIDIRALARTLNTTPEAPPAADELLSFGGSLHASPLGAPVLLPERARSSSNQPIAIGAAVAVFAALAAAAVVLVVELRDDPAPAEPPSALVGEPPADPPTPIGTTQVAEPPTSPTSVEPTNPPVAVAPTVEVAEPAPRATPRRPRPARVDPPSDPIATRPPVVRETPPEDDPLGRIFDERPEPTATPARALPATPNRGDVVSAMRALERPVASCGEGRHGTAQVNFRFASNGSVASADVTSELPASVRSCIARAARGARVPEFARDSFSVAYPFRL